MATPLYRLRSSYKKSVAEYASALEERRQGAAARAFARTMNIWRHICNRSAATSIVFDAEMHLVVLFSLAVSAGHKAEAERIYSTMDTSVRALLDNIDARESGGVKIWRQIQRK